MALHCRECVLGGIPKGQSPKTWARLEAFVDGGIIFIRCVRHDQDVAAFSLAEDIKAECEACGDHS